MAIRQTGLETDKLSLATIRIVIIITVTMAICQQSFNSFRERTPGEQSGISDRPSEQVREIILFT